MYTDRYTSTLEDAGGFDRHYADDVDDRPAMADVADDFPRRDQRPAGASAPEPSIWASRIPSTDPWLQPGAPADVPPF